jgi:hypothetical protein
VGTLIENLKSDKMFRRIISFCLIVALIASCKKDGFGPLSDVRPAVPVTVSNVYDYRPSPTVKASKAENKIVITLEIPASTGRTIKEVSKIAAATTGNYSAIMNATAVGTTINTQLWSNTPIAVNARTYTFQTSFDEYKTKTGTTTNPTSNALLARDFYFALLLDNGEVIIPQNVRVWVVD